MWTPVIACCPFDRAGMTCHAGINSVTSVCASGPNSALLNQRRIHCGYGIIFPLLLDRARPCDDLQRPCLCREKPHRPCHEAPNYPPITPYWSPRAERLDVIHLVRARTRSRCYALGPSSTLSVVTCTDTQTVLSHKYTWGPNPRRIPSVRVPITNKNQCRASRSRS